MFKRLAGSEFCSDAHRRDYKEEYSQLALGRLLQSQPLEKEARAGVKIGTIVTAFVEEKLPAAPIAKAAMPVVSKGAPIIIPPAQTKSPPATFAAKKADPTNARPNAEPSATKKSATAPAIAAPMSVQKPAPAGLQLAVVVTPEFERAMASLIPAPPRRLANMSPAALPQGNLVRLDRRIVVADFAMHPTERELELRETVRTTLGIGLDLSVVGAESLEPQVQSLSIPASSAVAPSEEPLWTEAPRHFTGSAIALSAIAKFQFSTTGFADLPVDDTLPNPAEVHSTPLSSSDATLPPEGEEPLVGASEPRSEAMGQPNVLIPEPALQRLPVLVQGVAAGKSKAVQVFGAASFCAGPVKVPQPSGLPLRPLIVLAAVESPGSAAPTKSKASVLPPTQPIPSPQELATLVQTSAETGLGLPDLRAPSSQNTLASRMPKILAAMAGAAVLAIGTFLVLTNRSDAGPNITISAPAGSDQWITNFAPDAKQQRKVSVLRSSLGLADYRLDFESSIGIKALGWVYRAQDAKNFYAGKIELEKAGLNPKYVIAHYAVIGGVEQPGGQTPLQIRVPLGGHYKIRFEAVGNRFTTWIADQMVDDWTDDRLTTGGAGLYREGIEQSTLHGDFRVTPLSKKK
jgi:hypothetical protein